MLSPAADSLAAWGSFRRSLRELRGSLVALAVMAVVIIVLASAKAKGISYFDVSTISGSAASLALAAIGETIVILGGGLDLSVGPVISLVNVLLVTLLGSAKLDTFT